MARQLKRTSPQTSPQLLNLASRLKAWRKVRQPGQCIPPKFWKAAAKLARVHGLSPTASALRLSYYDLQRRAFPGRTRPKVAGPAFVQLPAPAWSPGTLDPPHTLELHNPSGSRLTMRWPQVTLQELLPLVQAFLRS